MNMIHAENMIFKRDKQRTIIKDCTLAHSAVDYVFLPATQDSTASAHNADFFPPTRSLETEL